MSDLSPANRLWVWATSKGIRLHSPITYRYRKPKEPRPHFYWTNQVRLYTELEQQKNRRQFTLISDRQLQHEGSSFKDANGDRYPDTHLIRDDGDIAIQVELWAKSNKRYHDILWRLAAQFDSIWYWVNDRTEQVIYRQLEKLPESIRNQFIVYHLNQTLQTIPVQASLSATRL